MPCAVTKDEKDYHARKEGFTSEEHMISHNKMAIEVACEAMSILSRYDLGEETSLSTRAWYLDHIARDERKEKFKRDNK